MEVRFCDDRGEHGFSWIVDEPMARTSHALAMDGRLWLVDPVDWPEAIDRAGALGEPAAVLQLLDRHNRDCAAVAERLGVPHVVAPAAISEQPVRGRRRRAPQTVAGDCPLVGATRTLVVAEAVGTGRFFTGGDGQAGVHPLLRLTPPRVLSRFEPGTSSSDTARACTARKPQRPCTRRSREAAPGCPACS